MHVRVAHYYMPGISAILAAGIAAQSISNDTIGLANGFLNFTTPNWNVAIVKDSHILASLKPKGDTDFDFSPAQYLPMRAANGNYHLGDINLRYRQANSSAWVMASSALNRSNVNPIDPTTLGKNVLAASDLAPTLPRGIPFRVTRQWITSGNELGLTFTVTNTGSRVLEIGAAGFPIEFNSIFTYTNDVYTECSFTDPNIGLDAGYLRVARLQGTGHAMAVTPIGSTPLEAWNFLHEDEDTSLYYHSQVFEGFYEWQTHTLAYSQQEWAAVEPWNTPTSVKLARNQSVTWGLQFNLSPNIHEVENTVASTGTPHVIAVPGYIIPQDLTAKLFFTSTSSITSFALQPANAATVTLSSGSSTYDFTPTRNHWGRTRLTVYYADGKTQTVSFYLIKSAPQAVMKLGNFLTTSQWFTDTSDPFHRAPSVISYDNSLNAQVTQEERAWIAGLSDEGGAGSFLAAAMKQYSHPVKAEVAKLDQFLMQTVSNVLQPTTANDSYAVRKSIFYYQPSLVPDYHYSTAIDWTNWWSWDKAEAYDTERAYDYVHVTAAWWAIYRAARDYPSLKLSQPATFYLIQAYQTVMRCMQQVDGDYTVGYALVGLMGETVWGEVLADLQREDMVAEAANLTAVMLLRVEFWKTLTDPFGSEMAWDCTGQEGVYYWSNYFGASHIVTKTINTIFGYMPAISHWGWNGNARRYWDFIYAGKLMRYERMIHHYGSGLNALPLLSHFRQDTSDFLALRTAYGGMNGPLSNIGQSGSSHLAFHSWPDTLAWDAYTGDYGPNFSGLTLGSAVYIASDPSVGGLAAFGANYDVTGTVITAQPRDAVKKRVFIAPMSLMVEISGGAIEQVVFDSATNKATLSLIERATNNGVAANQTIVWLSNGVPTENGSSTPYSIVSAEYPTVRHGSLVQLGATPVEIVIQ